MTKKIFIVDGGRFSTLKEFYKEIKESFGINCTWGHNLDAFNDILRGGFGTPEEGFVIKWTHSELSKVKLGKDFDRLIEIIRCHCVGGDEEEDGVELHLC
ncbi:barstar family protein [Phragmitibacter flavus]|uniref:Barstar family protein n=1 Tax=Phragmitibacter flavus TaxID=2576071 RepID=A0A5R8KBI9_9BACT|nr:barstar family protein [Phragmitibacter flavus]TLD69672.1 barstar family protein [Phragmitibacter flavus]